MTGDLAALVKKHLAELPQEAKTARRGTVSKPDHTLAEDRMPWERQPWESDKLFDMFTCYRDMPAPLRSLDGAYRIYCGLPEDAKVNSHAFRDASAYNHWPARVEAYSLYVDERLRAALEEERVRVRLQYLKIGKEMREKAQEALSVMESIVHEKDPDTGEPRARSALSVRQIIELTRASLEYEKFALMMDQWNKGAGTTVNVVTVTDAQLLRDAKDVLAGYERVGVVIDAADP